MERVDIHDSLAYEQGVSAPGFVVDLKKFAADPELAEANLERFLSEKEGAEAWDSLPLPGRQNLVRVFGYSQSLSRYLFRNPSSAAILAQPKALAEVRAPDAYRARLRALAGDGGGAPEGRERSIFRFKYDELLRIAIKDLAEIGPYDAILSELSGLADSILDWILEEAVLASNVAESDRPRLTIIGQGKLGSQELNYSSDVDIQFVYAGQDPDTPTPVEMQEIAARIAQDFLTRIQKTSEEGFLYRVDLALRPEGASGALVNSVYAAELYYETWGLPWERFALLRSRPCAGDLALGARFLESVEPFVFKKYLSLGDVQSVKKIKDEQARLREQPGKWNVKTGAGGIRDIEFFVQGHQILNAGKKPTLRTPVTLKALEALSKEQYISPGERDQLKEAYLFLRRLETHLQMEEESQTYHLKTDHAARLTLARSMGYGLKKTGAAAEKLDDFEEDLQVYRTVSREAFERFLGDFDPPNAGE
ncbi:MAG: hypothetical protein HYT87_01250 [Nitrospirae bacterium]|nr:hypothetical protein [Nitrospirota bacterium]